MHLAHQRASNIKISLQLVQKQLAEFSAHLTHLKMHREGRGGGCQVTSADRLDPQSRGRGGGGGGAYAASFGQRVAAVSRKCALARLLQLVVAGLLDDGFKSCLHATDGAEG